MEEFNNSMQHELCMEMEAEYVSTGLYERFKAW